METLTREQAVWAAGMGISIQRAAWLLSCPKHTRGSLTPPKPYKRPDNPDCYLVRVNGSLYFRLNRRAHNIVERCPQDIEQARAYRDRRLAELGLKEQTT